LIINSRRAQADPSEAMGRNFQHIYGLCYTAAPVSLPVLGISLTASEG